MKKGIFIVVDGVDGAGKGPQIALLRDAIAGSGRTVHVTAEPSDWPIGAMIRRYLRRELTEGLPGGEAMALLFAADRMQHLAHEIEPRLERGEVVLCDRYDASSIAYQSATMGGDDADLEWIAAVNGRARRPDVTIVLDLDPDVAAERRAARGAESELFERIDLQRRVRAQYAKVSRVRPRDRFEFIDASPPIVDVHARIWRIVSPLLGVDARA
ncbi:MAG: dTMP kinase [Polyangiales bacterium]